MHSFLMLCILLIQIQGQIQGQVKVQIQAHTEGEEKGKTMIKEHPRVEAGMLEHLEGKEDK